MGKRDKELYDKYWNKIIKAVISNNAKPLCTVYPVNFPFTESANLSEAEGEVEGTTFAGMAD